MQLNLETSESFEEQLQQNISAIVAKELSKVLMRTNGEVFPPYMNKKQASKYLNVAYNTFDAWATNAHVPFVKVGNVTRYKRSDLDSFLATHSN